MRARPGSDSPCRGCFGAKIVVLTVNEDGQLVHGTCPDCGGAGLDGPVKRTVQRALEEVREKIGVLSGIGRLVIHGWRYTAAKQLAEAGCSDAEIQSVTGHKTLAMVHKYRAQASQKRASKAAQNRRERNGDGT